MMFHSNGFNVVRATNGHCIVADGAFSTVDPLLGPLQNNAGPTRTHALGNGSPAINAGVLQVPSRID